MLRDIKTTDELVDEITELKNQLFEANSIIEAIKEGSVDALVLNHNGSPAVYSLESADYTYRVLIEKFGEGAVSISKDGVVLYCNDYFSKLTGLPSNKIVGTYFNSYIESVGEFQQLKDSLKNGPSNGELVLNIDGKKLHVYASLTDLNPTVPALGIIITDLTEKRKNEEALELYRRKLELKVNELNQINRNLEEFIHVVSHDIKEPLRKIVAYSNNLTGNELVGKEDNYKISAISNSALRLNSLVDDLVKYAFNTSKTEAKEVDLNIILKEVKEDLAVLINDNSVVIESETLPSIAGSDVQMRQLFSNLITNAIKYRKKEVNPFISISTEVCDTVDAHFPDKKFIKIDVSDNGIGMDVKYLGKIFTIFHRLHMPGEYPGNGIGLAICKKIMENHMGQISAESSLNNGSTFNLYFPQKN